jgi:hypothetical protein
MDFRSGRRGPLSRVYQSSTPSSIRHHGFRERPWNLVRREWKCSYPGDKCGSDINFNVRLFPPLTTFVTHLANKRNLSGAPQSLNLSSTQKSVARRDWARDGAADYQCGRGRTGRVWHALGHPASGVTHFSLFADEEGRTMEGAKHFCSAIYIGHIFQSSHD